MTSLFLSYARSDDGEPFDPAISFVARLHRDLTAAGFDVWFDRVSMPSRTLTFYQEIRDAVATRDRLVLVVGPKSAESLYVRQEWQFAYFEAEKIVTPILRCGEYSHVPDELKLLHCEDFRDDDHYEFQLKNLVRQLAEPVPPLGKLIAVPSLPPHFLSRTDRLLALRDAVRADLDRPVVITGAAARVGMHGMGGIGKSVLASALARDRKVREAFPDGIVWLGLGPLPTIAELQRRVHKDLGGDGSIQTEHEGRVKLREMLKDKRVLLILDDAWRRADVDWFDILGPRCRAVISTRDSGLLTSLGGVHHVVELLTEQEALNILAQAAGTERDMLPSEAVALIAECGRLPLAVALCGGMVRSGIPWRDVLEALREHELEFISNEHGVESQHANLWRAMEVSVRMLGERNANDPLLKDAGRRFAELAVFPPDELIPEAAVLTLWSHTGGLGDRHARKLLILLQQRSLLHLTRAQDGPESHVSMHDLLFDLAVRLSQRDIGDSTTLHNTLVHAYAKQCPSGWHSGPNDGYYLQHICKHLGLAGRVPELCSLLLASPQWINTKREALTNDESFATDLLRASQLLHESQDCDSLMTFFQLRTASQVIIQRGYEWDDELHVLATSGKLREALGQARLRPTKKAKLAGLISVLETVGPTHPLVSGALDAIEQLASDIPDDPFSDFKGRASVLFQLAGLPESALRLANSIEHDVMLAEAFRQLLSLDISSGRFPEGQNEPLRSVSAARAIRSPYYRAKALLQCAETLIAIDEPTARSCLEECLDVALAIKHDADVIAPRAESILCNAAATYSALDQSRASTLRSEVQRRADSLPFFTRDVVLEDLVESFLKTQQFEEAIEVAKCIRTGPAVEKIILTIAIKMAACGHERADLFFDLAIDAVLDKSKECQSGEPLDNDSPQVRTGTILRSTDDTTARLVSQSLCEIVKALAENSRFAMARRVLDLISDSERRSLGSAYLARGYSNKGDWPQAIETANAIPDEYWRVSAFRDVALDLGKAKDVRALHVFSTYRDLELSYRNHVSANAQGELARVLAMNGRTKEARIVASRIKDVSKRIAAYCTICSLSKDYTDLLTLLESAETELDSVSEPFERVDALCKVAIASDGRSQSKAFRLLEEAWSIGKSIEDINRVQPAAALRIVAAAMQRLGHPEWKAHLDEARSMAQLVTGYEAWTKEMCEHARILVEMDDSQTKEWVDLVKARVPGIDHDFSRNRSGRILAETLALCRKTEEAIEVAEAIADAYERECAFVVIANALAVAGNVDQGVVIARRLRAEERRLEALSLIGSVKNCSGGGEDVLKDAVSIWQSSEASRGHARACGVLADALAEAGDFVRALEVLGPRDLNEFIGHLARWSGFFDKRHAGGAIPLLREVLRILGWVSVEFKELVPLFS